MPPRPDDVLNIGVDLDAKRALQAMHKFQRSMKTEMAGITKTVKSLDKTNKKFLKGAIEDTEDWQDAIEDLSDATQKHEKVLKNLEARAEKASGEELVNLREQIKLLQKITAGKKLAGGGGKGGGKGRGGGKGKGGGGGAEAKESFRDVARDAKDALKDSIGSFFSKDLKGLVENSTKLFGKSLKLAHKGASVGVGSASKGLASLGGGLKDRGAAKGGMAGAAMGAAGGGLKAISGMIGKFGPLLEMLGKIGPILSTVSTVMVAVVKLMIDAEAGAKEFQKDLLATASTAEFLGDAGYNADAAFAQLEDTVHGVRNAAFSLDNIKWGITPEETKTVVSALNQEGLSLRTIGQEATRSGKTVQAFTGDLVHSSVAYSRAFGVPLQEISQMQSELFTEMGQSIQQTQMGFDQMTRSAIESGIASNKFFAMIRGVSADLSLYNTRLVDTVKLLGTLGKVMNPRNAQKFMQSVTGFMKGKSRTDLLKTALLGGKGSSKALDRDLDRKAQSIGDTIQQASGKAFSKEDLLKKPIDELLSGVGKEQQGAIREAVSELRMDTKASKQGVFGRAMASENAGPAASYDMMKNSLNIAGTGKLADRMGDIGTQMLAENQGISQETLRGMAKFEMGLDDQKESLKAGLKDPDKRLKTIAKLQKAGIKLDEKSIDAADTSQVFDTMDEGAKEMAKVDSGVQDLGKAQANMTSSILQKLDALINFLMNQLYNVICEIRDMIGKLPWVGGSDAQKTSRSITRQASATRDQKTMEAVQKSTDASGNVDVKTLRENMINGPGGVGKSIDNAFKNFKEAQATGGSKEYAETAKAIGTLTDTLGQSMKPDQLASAMKAAGVGDDKIKQATADMAGGKSVKGAISGVGLTPDEIMKVYQKSLWFLDPEQISRLGGGLRDSADMVGKARVMGAKTDDLQMQLYNKYDMGDKAGATTDASGHSLKPSGFNSSKEGQAILKDMSVTSDATAAATQQAADKLDEKHSIVVKFSDQFLHNKFKKTMEDAILDSVRKALFEYYMYKDIDPEEMSKYMKDNNMSIGDMAKKMGEAGPAGQTGSDVVKGAGTPTTAPGHADGGMVTGVGDDGLAKVRAAAGEGLASIGPGERILPAGGGRGGGGGSGSVTIPINVNGIGANELARVIQVKVIDGIAEYKRRERLT